VAARDVNGTRIERIGRIFVDFSLVDFADFYGNVSTQNGQDSKTDETDLSDHNGF
jgi:hypothetical protein